LAVGIAGRYDDHEPGSPWRVSIYGDERAGDNHPGQESISSLVCNDGPLQWDYKERCGFVTDFAYFS